MDGNFLLWLMPEQVHILSLSEKYKKYAEKVLNLIENHEIRALVSNCKRLLAKKIRVAWLNKIPYMLNIAGQEEKDGTVRVRKHSEGDLGSISIETFEK